MICAVSSPARQVFAIAMWIVRPPNHPTPAIRTAFPFYLTLLIVLSLGCTSTLRTFPNWAPAVPHHPTHCFPTPAPDPSNQITIPFTWGSQSNQPIPDTSTWPEQPPRDFGCGLFETPAASPSLPLGTDRPYLTVPLAQLRF